MIVLVTTKNKSNHEELQMDIALSNLFYLLLEQDYAANLRELMLAIPEPTFLQLFKCAIRKWGNSTPGQQKANYNAMYKQWHPNEGTTKLWRHLRHCANLAWYTGQPLTDIQICDAALVVLSRTGAFAEEYKQFRSRPVANQSFAHLKQFFDVASATWSELIQEAG